MIIDLTNLGKAAASTRTQEFLANYKDELKRMGFSDDYVPSFNVMMCGPFVLRLRKVPGDDFAWLCNQASNMYKRADKAGCVDNFRISHDPQSSDYEESKSNGCCGFYDQKVTNPKTGRSYWIGCNYGH